MLGRNHAVYAAAAWMGAYPMVAERVGIVDASDPVILITTTIVAAGAGVLPDLDHPDSRVSNVYGPLSWIMSKVINSASGGHRVGTHTLLCAVLVGLATWSVRLWPEPYGAATAAVACGFCATIGLALVGPSLGLRMPAVADLALGAAVGLFVWFQYDKLVGGLWVLAAGGVIVHVLCDAVTKGGVPLLLPFTRRHFKLGLFRVGGTGEMIAGALGILGLGAAIFNTLTY